MSDTGKLYKAIQEYIEGRGGKVLVIGGVQILHYPGDPKYKYFISIQFTGRSPSVQPSDPPDHEHPAVSEGKSAKEIQKGYSDYLRSHRGR